MKRSASAPSSATMNGTRCVSGLSFSKPVALRDRRFYAGVIGYALPRARY